MFSTELFPHKQVREGQDNLMEDIEAVLKEGKTLLAHAPTGLGKTASALSVALTFALKNNKRIFFLTNRHTQHKIAIDTLKLIQQKKKFSSVDLIGKRWMCNQEISGMFGNDFNDFCKSIVERGECEFYNNVRQKRKVTVAADALVKDLHGQGALHNEELIQLTHGKRMCSYEISLELARKATVFIGDYYYLFNPFIQSTLFKKLDLQMEDVIIIVDEGHNLPSRVVNLLSSNLTSNMLKSGVMEAKKFGFDGIIMWLQELMRILSDLAEFEKYKEKMITRDSFLYKVKMVVDYDELVNEMELAAEDIRKKQRRSSLGGIAEFLEAWKGSDEGYVRILSEKKGRMNPILTLSYACLDPGIVTRDVFSSSAGAVVMSGTLQPTSMYKDVLGVVGMGKEYPSPFPPENKMSIIIPETTTKYSRRGEEMFRQIAERCSKLAALVPGNVAFFFPSYDLRDRVGHFFESDKKIFWEKPAMSKEEKEVFLAGFKQGRLVGGVLLGVNGANFAEGVDLPGDLLNGVVVVGLPLGPPDLKTKETIKYYEEKFGRGWDYGYIFPAMSKCIQSAGRCIRSERDKGAVIYLDERFAWQSYYGCLPREGLIVSKDYEKLLKGFFG